MAYIQMDSVKKHLPGHHHRFEVHNSQGLTFGEVRARLTEDRLQDYIMDDNRSGCLHWIRALIHRLASTHRWIRPDALAVFDAGIIAIRQTYPTQYWCPLDAGTFDDARLNPPAIPPHEPATAHDYTLQNGQYILA